MSDEDTKQVLDKLWLKCSEQAAEAMQQALLYGVSVLKDGKVVPLHEVIDDVVYDHEWEGKYRQDKSPIAIATKAELDRAIRQINKDRGIARKEV